MDRNRSLWERTKENNTDNYSLEDTERFTEINPLTFHSSTNTTIVEKESVRDWEINLFYSIYSLNSILPLSTPLSLWEAHHPHTNKHNIL